MVRLSVNVNKIATLRNARGGAVPSLLDAVDVCVRAGAPGITVHPRADGRHVTVADVREVAAALAAAGGRTEFNIEGDPRADLLALVHEVKPTQCTLVPVRPGEITSQAGWSPEVAGDDLAVAVADLRARGIRASLFVDAEERAIRWAAAMGATRVELYTEPFARAFEQGAAAARESYAAYARAADLAASLDMGVNAGHDLDLENLRMFRELPHLDEVSIGHALVSRAVFVGLDRSVREYLEVLTG
jgi:pyridoxine 5-phosphate synthase